MAIEIELKYLVESSDVKNKITAALNAERIAFTQAEKKLVNHYFETPDLSFRQHDMGLRVRESNGVFEQTIKTSGRMIGGLHQRPEYNVDIDSNFPQLALFPDEIWKKTQDVEQLQQQVLSIFTTNFQRIIWLITAHNGSEVELVFDQGTIETSGRNEDICEIELELVNGEPNDIFAIAELLLAHLALRPGIKSKAARGYGLWKNTPNSVVLTSNDALPITNDNTVDTALNDGVSQCLQRLQVSVDHYLVEKQLSTLVDITNILAVLRHGFWLFEKQVGLQESKIREEVSYFIKLLSWAESAVHIEELNNNTGNYRNKIFANQELVKQLDSDNQKFPEFSEISTLFHSKRFNALQLKLLTFILANDHSSDKQNVDVNTGHGSSSDSTTTQMSLKSFAKSELDKALYELIVRVDQEQALTIDEYINLRSELHRSLLTGTWLGGLFADEKQNDRVEYRSAWLDLQKGLSELQVLWVVAKKIDKLEQPSPKLVNWHANKVEGLMLAIEHSRKYALEITPYWR